MLPSYHEEELRVAPFGRCPSCDTPLSAAQSHVEPGPVEFWRYCASLDCPVDLLDRLSDSAEAVTPP